MIDDKDSSVETIDRARVLDVIIRETWERKAFGVASRELEDEDYIVSYFAMQKRKKKWNKKYPAKKEKPDKNGFSKKKKKYFPSDFATGFTRHR